jgi:2-methylcitrate dehydratase PrpD
VSTAIAADTLSERLAAWVCRVRYEDLPADVLDKAKDLLLFHLGSAVAGRMTETGRVGLEIARRLGEAHGPCTIVGTPERATATGAAIANAGAMIAVGDDYLLPAGGHPGVVTIPAALAIAEQEHRSGHDVLAAMVVGYELLGGLADLQWAWSAKTPRRATIPFGPFGPVAAAIRLFGLDPARAAHAIGYAANMAMGVAENPFGGIYYGFVARNGITAAVAAQAGGRVPATTLEGEHGFFMSFFDEIPTRAADVVERLGADWHVRHAQMKRWDTTGMNYPAIELMLAMKREHSLDARDIGRVVMTICSERKNHATGHATGPFASPWHANSSGPFHLALVLLHGKTEEQYYDTYPDAAVVELLRRFEVRLVDTPTKDYVKIEITTTDGRFISGEGDRYITPSGTGTQWFRDHATAALGPVRVDRVLRDVLSLETVSDVSTILEDLRGPANVAAGVPLPRVSDERRRPAAPREPASSKAPRPR